MVLFIPIGKKYYARFVIIFAVLIRQRLYPQSSATPPSLTITFQLGLYA